MFNHEILRTGLGLNNGGVKNVRLMQFGTPNGSPRGERGSARAALTLMSKIF